MAFLPSSFPFFTAQLSPDNYLQQFLDRLPVEWWFLIFPSEKATERCLSAYLHQRSHFLSKRGPEDLLPMFHLHSPREETCMEESLRKTAVLGPASLHFPTTYPESTLMESAVGLALISPMSAWRKRRYSQWPVQSVPQANPSLKTLENTTWQWQMPQPIFELLRQNAWN